MRCLAGVYINLPHELALDHAWRIFKKHGYRPVMRHGEVITEGFSPDGLYSGKGMLISFEFESSGSGMKSKQAKANKIGAKLVFVSGRYYKASMSLKDFRSNLEADIVLQLEEILYQLKPVREQKINKALKRSLRYTREG